MYLNFAALISPFLSQPIDAIGTSSNFLTPLAVEVVILTQTGVAVFGDITGCYREAENRGNTVNILYLAGKIFCVKIYLRVVNIESNHVMYFHPMILHHNSSLRQNEVRYRISRKITWKFVWSFFKCSKNMCKIHKARIRSSHPTYLLKVLKWRQCWIESWWRPLLHDGTRIWSSSVLLKHINNHDKISLSIINWYNVFRFGPHIYVCTYCKRIFKFGMYVFLAENDFSTCWCGFD